ncbi:alpha/beta fold hydrolase [Paragemmobacter straminiformis]|uniref:Alpha/beta hydrolase n=1 Tax=Paragemmobacter straminiformis TaxID=2045119 RepID=A0A842I177_9RHOB|nr:alpha/beta hydrolase [Gemmobacter straminiformis]MBC2833910.1 alpha/beta hydrolase [Gemmobacter straminiformis]
MTAAARANASPSPAPYYAEVADGPAAGHAFWVQAPGARIRIGIWPEGSKGTVLLLPGRTEYVEKYGRAAEDLRRRGYASVAIDWRGQGLADRPEIDRMVGHVAHFDEYQHDLDAALAFAASLDLPQPFYMLAHSMGGCIGLRALMRGLPFKAAAFSAPMWGISLSSWMRPLAHAVTTLAGPFGQALRYAPMTNRFSYVLTAPMAGNVLTTDPDMWHYMHRQLVAHPDLALGGPSLGWVNAALRECGALSNLPAPATACLTALGTAERVVDVAPIHERMAGWRTGRLDLYQGAEHEVIMETGTHRTRFFDSAAALFDSHR